MKPLAKEVVSHKSFSGQGLVEPNEEMVSFSKSQEEPYGAKIPMVNPSEGFWAKDEMGLWEVELTSPPRSAQPNPITPSKRMEVDKEAHLRPTDMQKAPMSQNNKPLLHKPSPCKGGKKWKDKARALGHSNT